MKGRSLYKIFGGIGVILAGLVAYKVYNKPHRDIASEQAAYILTADELFDEFETDENSANYKFLDKVLEVSGTIADISVNTEGSQVITLSAANAMLGGVSATMSSDETSGSLHTGDPIQLKCRCTGKLMDVVLIDCSMVNKE